MVHLVRLESLILTAIGKRCQGFRSDRIGVFRDVGYKVMVVNDVTVIIGMLDIIRSTLVNDGRIVDFLLRWRLEIYEFRAKNLGEE